MANPSGNSPKVRGGPTRGETVGPQAGAGPTGSPAWRPTGRLQAFGVEGRMPDCRRYKRQPVSMARVRSVQPSAWGEQEVHLREAARGQRCSPRYGATTFAANLR
jgi:hypothetical protein